MNSILIDKLKLDQFENLAMIKPAREAQTAFFDYPFPNEAADKLQLAIAYVYSLEEMKSVILHCFSQGMLSEKGQLYLLYPKNKNKLGHAPIHRDTIFPYLEVNDDGYVKGTDYKFNRMVALDENYTLIAVKFLPKAKMKTDNRPSGRVGDYTDKVEDIENFLKDYPAEWEFYKTLTPGYQRDWARYVYSAKTEVTANKRLSEMVEILKQGYKTKQLYRESKK
jgi:hypothetical protein